jgi:uncharacterized membrane protein YkvA (DUF1232 family)
MDTKQEDFYKKIRSDIQKWVAKNSNNKWADYILLAPDLFHLLTKLMLDVNVPSKKKIMLGVAIAYFISPIDFLPEALLGPFGFLDDIAVAAFVLNDMLNEINPQIILNHWAGDKDLLYTIKNIIVNSQQMLGANVVKKIMKKFNLKN